MEKIDVLKSVLKSSSAETTNIASKIKNIEGKIRMPIRNVTFVQPLNDVTKPTKLNPNGNIGGLNSVEPECTTGLNMSNASQVGSFAEVLKHKVAKQVVKVKELRNSENVDGAAVTIPLEAVEEVSSRFVNTLYGYFIGDRLVFPLVENYVKNTWAKYGLKRIQLHEEFFLFQFDTNEGMVNVMENGPWLTRRMPLILNVWTPNTVLKKEEIKLAPIWANNDDMCLSSWGRSTYARVLIEVSADKDLMEYMVIAIPLSNGKGHYFATIDIAYEWKPPRCSTCAIFDHVTDQCPKNLKVEVVASEKEDGFTEVKRKKSKVKQNLKGRHVDGVRLNKPPVNFYYRKVEKGETSKKVEEVDTPTVSKGTSNEGYEQVARKVNADKNGSKPRTDVLEKDSVVLKNSFGSLGEGTRIILSWNHNDVDIVVINQDDQNIHVRVWLKLERKELPWCILGDFNAALFLHDSSAGNSNVDISMCEFKECGEEIEVMDVQHSGLQFTWSQKPKGKDGLLKKIDRVMANLDFNDTFAGAHANFKPYRISDHSPSILNIPTLTKPKPKPFKFYNIITSNENFAQKPLRKLLYDKGNLHLKVNQLRDQLDHVQRRLDMDPFNVDIHEEEASTIAAFNEACIMEEKFLKQKAKIDWLREGDSNSAYFHKAVKSRNENVDTAFVAHYESFLGQPGNTCGFNDHDLFRITLDQNVATDMIRNVTRQEVKSALFSMGNEKSLSPDGFTAAFFKESWDIVADDLVAAVCEFFTNGKILKELNHTIIALIPKDSLKVLVSPDQSAFVLGRNITDNILLTQELMHNYHLDHSMARCAFKVDIEKAYDTIDWDFLKKILTGFGFYSHMIGWIMECVTTTSFSICINPSFTYHKYCSKLELINLCFAGDLFLFAHGDVDLARVIKNALFEFKEVSGLILPFEEGRLPIKYLGVPLVSSWLIFRDCKELIEKVQARVDDWKNKLLSAAGRLQLVRSVIGSLHCQGRLHKGHAKVAWEVVCLPKDEGGLGVR
ncbi:hypothetical protein Tco_0751615, partial [Tanacetum coccineum]